MSDYPYIRAWGRMMGSMDYYISDQIARAREDKAPQTAIYKDHDSGEWHTFEGITRQDTKELIGKMVNDMKSGVRGRYYPGTLDR